MSSTPHDPRIANRRTEFADHTVRLCLAPLRDRRRHTRLNMTFHVYVHGSQEHA